MPTVTTKSIGTTGRDYSTIQAWEDAAAANLVTADEVWKGEAYNDSEFTAALVVTGSTTDATRYKWLTVASGQSFQDNAGVRTNLLDYNQSYGVGVRRTGNYQDILTIQEGNFHIDRFQVKTTGNGSFTIATNSSAGGLVMKDCIFSTGGGTFSLRDLTTRGFVYNCLIIHTGTSNGIVMNATTLTFVGCGLVRTTTNSPTGTAWATNNYSSACIMQSCYSFGFTTVCPDTSKWTGASCTNNATDQSSGLPGSGQQYSITYSDTSPFTQASNTATDFRTITGTNLSANGTLDATNAPNDISGTARANPPTIGPWELVTASSAIKTIIGLAKASVKTVNGLAIASVKKWDGLA